MIDIYNLLIGNESNGGLSEQFRESLIPYQASRGVSFHSEGQKVSSVLFPIDSLCIFTKQGNGSEGTELAVVGNEGLVGFEVFLGLPTSITNANSLTSGSYLAANPQAAKQEFQCNSIFRDRVLSYLSLYLAQITQTALCNQFHRLEEKFCRLLLVTIDRLDTLELNFTQESIASVLGSRRESVSLIAAKLQRENIIEYSRGLIKIRDKAKLMERSCSCYNHCHSVYESFLAKITLQN